MSRRLGQNGETLSGKPLCPTSETLAGLLSGTLDHSQASQVRAHVTGCQACNSVVLAMNEFDGPQGLGPEWADVEKRLDVRFDRFLQLNTQATISRGFRIGRFLWNPAVAYVLAALMIYPAIRGINRNKQTPLASPPTPSLERPALIELNATRGAARPKADQMPPNGLVVFSLFLPARQGHLYDATIIGPSGQTSGDRLPILSHDDLGNFLVVGRLEGFPPGSYQLHVVESLNGQRTGRSFDFPFIR